MSFGRLLVLVLMSVVTPGRGIWCKICDCENACAPLKKLTVPRIELQAAPRNCTDNIFFGQFSYRFKVNRVTIKH